MPGGEQYMALQTGVLDGAISGIDMALMKFSTRWPRWAETAPLLRDIPALDEQGNLEWFPPELQKLIEQTANEISASEVERRQRAEDTLWSDDGKRGSGLSHQQRGTSTVAKSYYERADNT